MDTLLSSNGNTLEVVVTFFAESTARGAVMNCVSVNESGEINITSSVLLMLERINSTAMASFNLYPGQYQVLVYDIEQDGTLSSGVRLPCHHRSTPCQWKQKWRLGDLIRTQVNTCQEIFSWSLSL